MDNLRTKIIKREQAKRTYKIMGAIIIAGMLIGLASGFTSLT